MSIHAIQPFISVITPIFNGQTTLQRAIRSVLNQSFTDWELLAIDDGSTDGSSEIIEAWAKQDSRIRVFTMPENSGQCAACNLGFKHSRGEFICYLDQDDEYYPNYLATIDRWKDQGDMLFFQYDVVDHDHPESTIRTWQPDQRFQELFAYNIALPLGVAHPRKWFEKIGGFNELLWRDGEWDYWKRLVRAGAETLFVAEKCGIHHLRAEHDAIGIQEMEAPQRHPSAR